MDNTELFVEHLVDTFDGLDEPGDAVLAELSAASLLVLGATAGEGFLEGFANGLVPVIEANARPDALAVLVALGSVAPGVLGEASSAAAGRLVANGVTPPPWAAELDQPVEPTDCQRMLTPGEPASMLVCGFRRGGNRHGFAIAVDHEDCGAAADIVALDAESLAELLAGPPEMADGEVEVLDPAELRWQVEAALDARTEHDHDEAVLAEETGAEQAPTEAYPAWAELLRARMRTLPEPSKPKPRHGETDDR